MPSKRTLYKHRRMMLPRFRDAVDRTGQSFLPGASLAPWSSRLPGRLPAKFAGVVLAFFACVDFTSVAHAQSGEPSTALISSRAVALNPETGKVYAVDTRRNAVLVFDPRTQSVSSVRVGAGPIAIATNAAINRIYVANFEGGSVSVIDGTNDSVLATLGVGPRPYVVAVNPATNRIYVSNTFSNLITVIDGATNSTTTVKAGSADAIGVDSRLDKVYLLGYEDTNLIVLNRVPLVVGKIPVGSHAWSMASNETTGTLYVTRVGSAELVIVDEVAGLVTTVPTGAFPCGVAVNPVTNTVYVANHGDDTVTVIDGARRALIATVKVGQSPQAVAVDAKRNRVYVANSHSDDVTVIDGVRNSVLKTLHAGRNPYALAVDPNSGQLYVASYGEPALAAVDAR
jgi:YVTN family beta-propeller protein